MKKNGLIGKKIWIILGISIFSLLLIGLLYAAGEKQAPVQISGKIVFKNDQYILQSGKEKLVLAMLTPAELDSLQFKPADNDEIIVEGYKKNNTVTCLKAVWNNQTFSFADSLGVPIRTAKSTWNVDADGCIGCRLCVFFCPVGAITMQTVGKAQKAVIDPEKCIGCNICAAGNADKYSGCPPKAIRK